MPSPLVSLFLPLRFKIICTQDEPSAPLPSCRYDKFEADNLAGPRSSRLPRLVGKAPAATGVAPTRAPSAVTTGQQTATVLASVRKSQLPRLAAPRSAKQQAG
ncbi:hypothetical protein BDZ85DRAFT_264359 [Elsinoe ampelina]|uniref:Uncharacterized protein n=1 Tax=Elsinoe ampelina TaxID=302913 RepID=A0A6A6G7U3_9PEZI|nr:hypothetical protein BDZ85DRAFT_264359 [Elsinoe ampelina]